jgi:hypothetical protein
MSTMSDFTLGQRVRFTRPMKRQSVPLRYVEKVENYSGAEHKRKLAVNKAWVPNEFSAEAEGIIVGKRTLSNGHHAFESDGWEGGYWLNEPAEYFTAYMVVSDLRSAPVHVLPEHITALEATK